MKIELIDAGKSVKGVQLLKHVNATFTSNHIYGLYGPNGSGKTMLLRMLCGLIYPSEGKVLVDELELGKQIDFPTRVGLLLENPAFLSEYTGKKNLELLADICHRIDEAEIDDAINRVGLSPNDRRKYGKYSLGMKQRLGIAGAIMESPDLILLDEPTNALDKDGVQLIKSLIMDEKKRGALIVIACHDFEFLKEITDSIFNVSEGTVAISNE